MPLSHRYFREHLIGLAMRFAPCRPEFEPPEADLLAEGGTVYLRVEKNPLVWPTPKHRSKASPVSRELWCRYVWVGQRFGGFLDLREKVFFLSTMPGGCLTPAG